MHPVNLEKVRELEYSLVQIVEEEGPPSLKQMAAMLVGAGLNESIQWLKATLDSSKEDRVAIITELEKYLSDFMPKE